MKKIALLCLAAVLCLSGCSSSNTTGKNTKNIQETTNNQFLMGGKIATNEQADVSSKISAKVSEISVDIGSTVKEGDVIIKLDTKDLQGQVDQAGAAVNTAQANLTNAQSGTRPEQIAEAQINVNNASQSYQTIKKNYDRTQALLKSGAATQQELDSAQQQLSSADAQCKTAQEQLAMLKNGNTESAIDVFKAQVNQANSALKTAQTAFSNATITAPISGSIGSRNINVGDMVSPGTPIVSIINSSNLYVNAYAPLDIISKLSVGQAVVVKVSEISDKEFEGKISVINSQVNAGSRDVLVKVTITDKDPTLKPGMFAEVGLKN